MVNSRRVRCVRRDSFLFYSLSYRLSIFLLHSFTYWFVQCLLLTQNHRIEVLLQRPSNRCSRDGDGTRRRTNVREVALLSITVMVKSPWPIQLAESRGQGARSVVSEKAMLLKCSGSATRNLSASCLLTTSWSETWTGCSSSPATATSYFGRLALTWIYFKN